MNRKERVLSYLKGVCLGRDRCMGGKELGQALNLNGTELRKAVNRLRQKCEPIASDRNGYFYAQTAGEIYAVFSDYFFQRGKQYFGLFVRSYRNAQSVLYALPAETSYDYIPLAQFVL